MDQDGSGSIFHFFADFLNDSAGVIFLDQDHWLKVDSSSEKTVFGPEPASWLTEWISRRDPDPKGFLPVISW